MSCDKKMTFEECELAILRHAVDNVDKIEGEELLRNPEVKTIIEVVEEFLKNKKRICYGGTAINALLPPDDQFYDPTVELPDYDFFSPNPMKDAKELADIYYKKGFSRIEAKAGVHAGTFKVFVNFIPVADITYLVPELFRKIKKEAVSIRGILYSPPNFLRMLMYLELSRPKGSPSRWEKVLKRISLLNKNYPLRGKHCEFVEIQRFFDVENTLPKGEDKKIFQITRDSLMNQGVIFFGAMANQMYLRYLKKFKKMHFRKTPDFDVLSEDPEDTAKIVKDKLKREGIKDVKIKKKKGVGEVIATHYELIVRGETILMIYEPLACHSYNMLKIKGRIIKIATIDTMLSLYLAFMYVNRPYYDPNRIICMAEYLFKVQQYNRLSQKGILKRFSINCYGKQETLTKIREEKSHMYETLKRGTKKWNYYFLKYDPSKKYNPLKKYKKKHTRKKKKIKSKKKNKTRRSLLNLIGI
jgi:hypothetical protein